MRAMAAGLVTALVVAACGGGGDDDKAAAQAGCIANSAPGPVLGDDLLARVLITGNVAAPFTVVVTAHVVATQTGDRYIALDLDGDRYEWQTITLQAGESRDVRLEHRFTGGETSNVPAYAYFTTLSVLDNGANRSLVTQIHVEACAAP